MAAAINILFRGKYGWGFPVRGAFAHTFLCLMVVLPNNPNPVARLLRVDAVDKAIL